MCAHPASSQSEEGFHYQNKAVKKETGNFPMWHVKKSKGTSNYSLRTSTYLLN